MCLFYMICLKWRGRSQVLIHSVALLCNPSCRKLPSSEPQSLFLLHVFGDVCYGHCWFVHRVMKENNMFDCVTNYRLLPQQLHIIICRLSQWCGTPNLDLIGAVGNSLNSFTQSQTNDFGYLLSWIKISITHAICLHKKHLLNLLYMNAIWTFFSEINALQFSDKLFLMLPPVEIFGWMIHWSFKCRPVLFSRFLNLGNIGSMIHLF
jgi:hypothetical protein